MSLSINTIIHLEDEEKFVLLSETEYGGGHYFLVMGVDDEKEVIPQKVAILEEQTEYGDGGEEEIYVDRVTDPELVVLLTGILKPLVCPRHPEVIKAPDGRILPGGEDREPEKAGHYRHPWGMDAFYPSDREGRTKRLIDLRITGLDFDTRQNIFQLLDAIGVRLMENLAEEADGFPGYCSVGYDEEQLVSQKQKAAQRLQAVNDFMTEVGRPLFFTNPENTYESAWEYYELMRYQTPEALAEKYGFHSSAI